MPTRSQVETDALHVTVALSKAEAGSTGVGFAEAVADMARDDASRRRRAAAGETLRNRITELEGFLLELEEVHLRGGVKVPEVLASRIEQQLLGLPAGARWEFPVRRARIVGVIENLEAALDSLLTSKDQSRRYLLALDEGRSNG